MDWFGHQRRAKLEDALLHVSAQLHAVEAIALGLLSALPSERERAVERMRRFVVEIGDMPLPTYISKELEQAYRNEVRRVFQAHIWLLEQSQNHRGQSAAT